MDDTSLSDIITPAIAAGLPGEGDITIERMTRADGSEYFVANRDSAFLAGAATADMLARSLCEIAFGFKRATVDYEIRAQEIATELMSQSEAAQVAGVTRQSITHAINKGHLCLVPTGTLLFRQQVMEWVECRRAKRAVS